MSNEIPPIPPSILEAAAHIPEEELETMRERSEGDVYYAAIGRIATEWATFEHSIQIEIWKLIQLDYQISACLTSQIGQSGRLMDCLIALLSLRGAEEDHLKSIRSFASKIGDYQRRRNRMVHDPLFFEFSHDKIKALRMEISASKKPVYEPIHETIDDLYKFILKIDALTDELSALVGAKPVKPWPEKLPLPSALQPRIAVPNFSQKGRYLNPPGACWVCSNLMCRRASRAIRPVKWQLHGFSPERNQSHTGHSASYPNN